MRKIQPIHDGYWNTGTSKKSGDFVRAFDWWPLEFSQMNMPVSHVLNHSRLESIQTNETKSTHHVFGPEQRSQIFLVSKAVL